MAWDTERTRRRLKEAAVTEFAEHGFAGTKMTSIAARAGINKERLYSYFGDKRALWDQVLADELDALAAAVAVGGVGLDDIGEFAGATYDYHAEHPQLARRFAFVADVLREVVADIIEVRAQGEGDLAQLLDLVLVGDFVSLHLAAREGIDPGPVPVLDELKRRLLEA